jgi:hypothetical protein
MGGSRGKQAARNETLPVGALAIQSIKVKLLRGSINDVPGEYTRQGWTIDYSEQAARAVIIDTDVIGAELRKLRRGQRIRLKLQIEGAGETISTEYDGWAKVQMVRFRASRNDLPHFRVQFKFVHDTWLNGLWRDMCLSLRSASPISNDNAA